MVVSLIEIAEVLSFHDLWYLSPIFPSFPFLIELFSVQTLPLLFNTISFEHTL